MEYGQNREHQAQQQRPPSPGPSSEPSRKRQRISLACGVCRAKKSRCDGLRPKCSSCREQGYECNYDQRHSHSNFVIEKGYVSSLEQRLKNAEENIRQLQAHQAKCHTQSSHDNIQDIPSRNSISERILLSPSPLDETYVGTDDPRDQNEPENDADGMGAMTFSNEEDCGFYGPTSNIAFTHHISRAIAQISQFNYSPFAIENSDSQSLGFHSAVMNFPQPKRSFLHPNSTNKGKEPEVNIYALPPEQKTRELLSEYFNTTALLFPYIYESKFWETYEEMKRNNFTKVKKTWLGLLNMIMALTTSISLETGLSAEDRLKESYIFYQRASGLCDWQIMRGANLELVQYLLVSGQYLQGTQRSVETWTIHGLAVKIAFQLGLHSADASLRFPSLEREIRKRVWYGCVMLDRTLCMTFGRPAAIPEDYVQIDLPAAYNHDQPMTVLERQVQEASLQFYNSTITLYKIMWEIINIEYDGNLGYSNNSTVFNTVFRPLQLEQKLVGWERQLPENVSLIRSPEELLSLVPESSPLSTVRFRVILTLRYLNVRVLLHRPVLIKFLEQIGVGADNTEAQESGVLQQIGVSSLQSCVKSARDIIFHVSAITSTDDQRKKWLGAWWFSLYYTFNAALVMYATLLIIGTQPEVASSLKITKEELQFALSKAIEALRGVDRDNILVERCAKYLTQLVGVLEPLDARIPSRSSDLRTPGPGAVTTGNNQQQNLPPQEGQPIESIYGHFSSSLEQDGLDFGADLGEFMLGGDIEFLNQLTRLG